MTGGYNRREVLGALGAAFAGAGCLGGDSGDGTESPAAEYEDAEDNEYSAEFEESISGVEKSVEEIVDEYDDIVEGEEETAVLTDEGMATTSRYGSEKVTQDRYSVNVELQGEGDLSEFDRQSIDPGAEEALEEVMYETLSSIGQEFERDFVRGMGDKNPPREGEVISGVSVSVEGSESGLAATSYDGQGPEEHVSYLGSMSEEELREDVELPGGMAIVDTSS